MRYGSAGDRCGRWAWTACVTADGTGRPGGALFIDLPANLLGCFIIGILSSSASLGLDDGRSLAVLGRHHVLQRASSLQTGLRTGYCGCLTTFASWFARRYHM